MRNDHKKYLKRMKNWKRNFTDKGMSMPIEAENVPARYKPRKGHLEKKSNRGPSKIVSLRKKKTCNLSFENSCTLEPVKPGCIFSRSGHETGVRICKIDPSIKRHFEEMSNPFSKAVNRKKKKNT